jgi:hypothetical protein
MDIKYKEKPSHALVERYRSTLDKMLRHQQVRVKVELTESPSKGEWLINDEIAKITYCWIKDITISTPVVEKLSVAHALIKEGIDDNIDDEAIWVDAFCIQEALYRHLGRDPDEPSSSDDPYWMLWKCYKIR